MTFERALEAVKHGAKVYRKAWKGTEMDKICFSKDLLFTLMCDDVFADDWELYEPKNLWLLRANRHTVEDIEEIKKQLRNSIITILPEEESPMYTTIEITFKSGDTITYGKDEWDDYSYDGTSVCVKKDGAWVGIYNFDHVFSVELKFEG